MWVCTDRPLFAERLLGRRAPWRRVTAGDLAPEDSAVATVLLSGSEWFVYAIASESGWNRLLAAGHAARSQFDKLGSLLEAGVAGDRILAVTETGSEFHGWEGRRWVAAPGNLHLVAGSPIAVSAREGGTGMLIAPALALLDAIDAIPGMDGRARIRWVNDVLIDGAEVGGRHCAHPVSGDTAQRRHRGHRSRRGARPRGRVDVFVPRVERSASSPGPRYRALWQICLVQ